jgi:hypothetical protein
MGYVREAMASGMGQFRSGPERRGHAPAPRGAVTRQNICCVPATVRPTRVRHGGSSRGSAGLSSGASPGRGREIRRQARNWICGGRSAPKTIR